MDKFFVCLANSYKYGNRCVAGILVNLFPKEKRFTVELDHDGHPLWIRPINRNTEGGAIPTNDVQDFAEFDIIKASNVEKVPETGAQSENYYYERLEKIEDIYSIPSHVNSFEDSYHETILGNRGSAVPVDVYSRLNHSIMFVMVEKGEFYLKNREETGQIPQPRGRFTYKGVEYDLPVTDPIWRHLVETDINRANSMGGGYYFMTLSLAIEQNGWHSKLISMVCPGF